MWLLVIVLIICVLYAVSHKTRIDKKRCIQCITIILTLFSGLRSWQMGDIYHYCYAFLQCNSKDWVLDVKSHDSIGTQLLYRAVGQMHMGFEVCLFIIAAFSAITLGIMVYRYSSSPYLSYLMYICLGYYIFTLSGLKQTIAMGFVMLAMDGVFKSKPIKFLACVGLAGLFHTPALIFIIAYPFARKKINISYFVILFLSVFTILMFRNQIVSFATTMYYENDTEYVVGEGFGGKFIMMIAILLVSALIRPVKNYDHKYRYVFNIVIIATIIQSFSVYDNGFTRLADYFFQFFVLFVPMLMEDGYKQVGEHPEKAKEIRYYSKSIYSAMILIITIFSIIFYKQTVDASAELLSGFKFVWDSDASYSLNMLGE